MTTIEDLMTTIIATSGASPGRAWGSAASCMGTPQQDGTVRRFSRLNRLVLEHLRRLHFMLWTLLRQSVPGYPSFV
jgi:hypothetical protein